MDTQSARHTLSAIWALVDAGQSRGLTEVEIEELQRLCDRAKEGVPNCDEFAAAAQELCLSLSSSGVFQGKVPKKGKRLLEYVTDLQKMVD